MSGKASKLSRSAAERMERRGMMLLSETEVYENTQRLPSNINKSFGSCFSETVLKCYSHFRNELDEFR